MWFICSRTGSIWGMIHSKTRRFQYIEKPRCLHTLFYRTIVLQNWDNVLYPQRRTV